METHTNPLDEKAIQLAYDLSGRHGLFAGDLHRAWVLAARQAQREGKPAPDPQRFYVALIDDVKPHPSPAEYKGKIVETRNCPVCQTIEYAIGTALRYAAELWLDNSFSAWAEAWRDGYEKARSAEACRRLLNYCHTAGKDELADRREQNASTAAYWAARAALEYAMALESLDHYPQSVWNLRDCLDSLGIADYWGKKTEYEIHHKEEFK
jgi:hypothetical protein